MTNRCAISPIKRVLLAAMLAWLPVSIAKADPMRDFIVSCSYGVLAGTLVGAATLAFADKPGENLNRVARGASLGLYAGMLLGAYVVFGVPSEDEDAAAQLQNVSNEWYPGAGVKRTLVYKARVESSRWRAYPLVGERGLEGAAGQYQVMSF